MKPDSRLGARPFFDPRDRGQILADIDRVLESGRLILGPETEALECEFARQVGTRYAVAVSSCTAALEIALRALGAAGREALVPSNTFAATAAAALRATRGLQSVLLPTNTCAATAHAAAQAGGRVTLVDCDPDGNTSIADLLERMGPDTAAVVVVHVAGFVPRGFGELVEVCRARGVALVEDCAHAHGATLLGRQVGSFGDAGCFSFYPTKITTCGTGGMVTTDRADVARVARSLRHHGQGASLEEVVAIGHDWLLPEISAVLLRAQLRRLPEVLSHRRTVAAAYDLALAESGDDRIAPPAAAPLTGPVYYKYPVQLAPGLDGPAVRRRMASLGIDIGQLYWPPVHKMPAYAPLGLSMPRTEALLRRRICLPMHGRVDPEDCQEIVKLLRDCLNEERAHDAG